MVENIKLKIIESHEEILDVIDKNIGTLVNFDWHSDFPLYPDVIFDADIYSNMLMKESNVWLDNNWMPILVNRGFMSKYLWFYPHDCGKDEIKKFKAKKGDCEVYSIKFQNRTKLPYKCITIDMDFFGTRTPFNWSSNDRMGLFVDIIESLTARSVTMIIAKSEHYVNYNVEEFLEDITNEMSVRTNVEEVS